MSVNSLYMIYKTIRLDKSTKEESINTEKKEMSVHRYRECHYLAIKLTCGGNNL